MFREPCLRSPIFLAIGAICMLGLLTACSGKESASPSSSTSSSGAGAVAFTVEWEPRPESLTITKTQRLDLHPLAPAINVCSDYGIDTVTMQALSGQTVLAETSVPCSNHVATLNNVAAGSNLTLRITGSVPGAGNVWNGFSAPFNLTAGETKDVGKITVSYIGDDKTSPTITSVNPWDNATNVPETTTIQVAFSKPMAVNTVIDNSSFVVLDNDSKHVPGIFVPSPPPTGTSTFLFQPTSPLSSGVKHTVTIDNNLVTDMAGNRMGSSFSFAFHTRFRGQWGIPAQIESDTYTTSNGGPPFLDVALNDQGDAFAVWEETHIGPIFIYASRYNRGKNQWEAPTNISPSTANYSWSSRVVADNVGNAIAVWIQEYRYVVANRYSGGSWTGPVTFNDVSIQGENRGSPMIAMDNSGNAYVSYVGRLNNVDNIYVSSHSPASGQWNFNYYSAGGNCQGSIKTHKIAMKQGAKNYMLLYSCGDDSIYHDDSPPAKIGVGGNVDISSRNFRAVAVWDNASGLWSSFYDAKYYPVGWTGPVQISDRGTSPSVGMNDNGDIIALWGGGNDNVYVSHTTFTGKTWSIPINLSGTPPYTGGYDTYTKLGMDENGNAIAIWAQMQLGGSSIFVSRRYDSGTKTWNSNMENISKNDSNSYVNYPSFSMNHTGDAVAVWLLWGGNPSSPNVHANFWYK